MSNIVSTRVWTQSKQKRNHRLLLAALADGVNDQGVGFHGTRFLSEKILLSERQTRRLRDDLEATGEIYVRTGNGRGNETLYLVCTGLEEPDIVFSLTTFFEMDESEAKNVTSAILEKRWTFLKKVDISDAKVDKKRVKVDTIKPKSRTTINHKNHKIPAAQKSPQSKKAKPKLAIVANEPRQRDPLFDAIGKHFFDATTPAALEAFAGRIVLILYGDKEKKRNSGILGFESSRQNKPIDQLDRKQLAEDAALFWRNFKKYHADTELKDFVKIVEWWSVFRAAQDKQSQAVDNGSPWFDDAESVWKRKINGQLQRRDPSTGDWMVAA